MTKKTYAVAGATGHIGKAIVDKLKAQGHSVRPISRKDGVSLDDTAALTRALTGADAAFLMIPPDIKAQDLRKRQNELAQHLADAIKGSKIKRVVFLSSVTAHLKEGTGPVLGLHDAEERLNGLGVAELVYLRPAYFMENHLQGLGLIAQAGIYGTAIRPDAALPMIATQDIATKAVELLTQEPFRASKIQELLGPRDYTMAEATRILGSAIGKPDLKYVQFPYEEAKKAMLGAGLSKSMTEAVVEMARGINEGSFKQSEKRSEQNTTETTLERFAQEVFRKSYEKTPAGVH